MTDLSICEPGTPGKGARFEITVPKGNTGLPKKAKAHYMRDGFAAGTLKRHKGTKWTANDRIDEREGKWHFFGVYLTFTSQCKYFRMYILYGSDR